MRIFIDNFFQNCCGFDLSQTSTWLISAFISVAIIVFLTVCQMLSRQAGQRISLLWTHIQKGFGLHNWIPKAISCLPQRLSSPKNLRFWSQEGPSFYLSVLILCLSFTSCLLLPWSASHCNLPSKVTLCGFENSFSFILFFGLLLASNSLTVISKLLYAHNSEFANQFIKRSAWMSAFMIACLGPVILTGQLSISAIAEKQEEGLFGLPWLGIYAFPGFLGLTAALVCLCRWEDAITPTCNLQSKYKNNSFSQFIDSVTERFNFLALSSLIIILFGGSWNLPMLTYPAYLNLGFLIAPYTDLICGLGVFILKLCFFSIVWPSLSAYIKWQRKIRPSVTLCILLISLNSAICAILAGMYQLYLGG
ncbi:MAG: hypothetical protein ACI376_08665 [Candidatus Bruticola sp.]